MSRIVGVVIGIMNLSFTFLYVRPVYISGMDHVCDKLLLSSFSFVAVKSLWVHIHFILLTALSSFCFYFSYPLLIDLDIFKNTIGELFAIFLVIEICLMVAKVFAALLPHSFVSRINPLFVYVVSLLQLTFTILVVCGVVYSSEGLRRISMRCFCGAMVAFCHGVITMYADMMITEIVERENGPGKATVFTFYVFLKAFFMFLGNLIAEVMIHFIDFEASIGGYPRKGGIFGHPVKKVFVGNKKPAAGAKKVVGVKM
ncbi:hypothetical protein BdWA1_002793 [Babesia duncani]|uniref:Uncharacterized protein n=1 Tax=Babesia duncani TaxID=323732 RepID=A0AAD9UNN0_9APIC|nr:hypothetical protein BdWA1_002793 [Babesia duncani]